MSKKKLKPAPNRAASPAPAGANAPAGATEAKLINTLADAVLEITRKLEAMEKQLQLLEIVDKSVSKEPEFKLEPGDKALIKSIVARRCDWVTQQCRAIIEEKLGLPQFALSETLREAEKKEEENQHDS